MAKRRPEKPAHPLGSMTIPNPLDMSHINAIGRPPAERLAEQGTAVMEPLPEPKPAAPAPTEQRESAPAMEDRPNAFTRPTAPRQQAPRARPSARNEEPAKDEHQYKTRVTPQEAAEIELFREALSDRLGVKLRFSQISRALLTIVLRSEDELNALNPPELRRPPYGDALAMAAFEDALAQYLHAAIKRTRR